MSADVLPDLRGSLLSESMEAMSLGPTSPHAPAHAVSDDSRHDRDQPVIASRQTDFSSGLDLPPPDSDEWETTVLPPAPTRKPQSSSKVPVRR